MGNRKTHNSVINKQLTAEQHSSNRYVSEPALNMHRDDTVSGGR